MSCPHTLSSCGIWSNLIVCEWISCLAIACRHQGLTHNVPEQLLAHLSSPLHQGIPTETFLFYQLIQPCSFAFSAEVTSLMKLPAYGNGKIPERKPVIRHGSKSYPLVFLRLIEIRLPHTTEIGTFL